MNGLFRRTPQEYPAGPLEGHKLAFPMLSADGTTAGFSGVTLGRAHVYRTVDDAVCAHGCRHACPSRWCDCGFYCFHTSSDARELACAPEHQGAVLLEVAASGRFRRYELGLRYARQRVRTIRMRPCRCGAPVSVMADTGSGQHGWRRLEPVCTRCAGARPVLAPSRFAGLAGVVLLPDDVATGPLTTAAATAFAAPPDPSGDDGGAVATAGAVAVLTAEMALLQARLDEMARQLGRATARLDELEGRGRPASEPDR
ncbi:hypothetical protein [Pseudonocardia spirodelae]|uniref:Uncharacterized protein n=1 Tax=Pseudonocardia spirodelae TaxID=3133431 RepID=A0ABU8T054_9PSEU